MEDTIKDEVLGELDFQEVAWFGSLDAPLYN